MKYVCELCGYQYHVEKGDVNHQIPPGTDFEDLPPQWVCPLCGADKEDFEAIAETEEYEISED